ncbi:MAG: hypothetical protein NUK57_08205 [Gudongella sp.]|nr:hypothetical protein [Gudongella sp.]
MREDKVLNDTLEVLEEEGVKSAYDYVAGHMKDIPKPSGQYYNFLYCLAALDGKTDEAMGYLEEAIIQRGYWYRPEVFEDEDLDSLRERPRFQELEEISKRRYEKALERAETKISWEKRTKDNILLALHGNQQNMSHSREEWSVLSDKNLQVEYMQSEEIDSFDIFRWEDEGKGPLQLKDCLEKIQWDEYGQRILGGFSAGCNVILRAILEEGIDCSAIVLQSPWMPMIENQLVTLVEILKEKNIKVMIICGAKDPDCLEPSKTLASALINNEVVVKSVCVNELGHEFPEDFKEMVSEFIRNS